MQAYLKKLIRGESSPWPLVKQVNVSGPYPCLAGGLELVDLSGLNDPNEARVEVTREFLRTSPFVWVVFSMVRGLTEDIQRILREEKLLRTLVLSGTYGSLSLVGTKSDDIDTNIADQLGLPDDCTAAELVSAYRDQTVNEARTQLEQMVRDLASHNEGGETLTRMIEVARRVRVHATSARGYNKLVGVGRLRKDYGITDVNETGIPGVHEHLADIGRQAGAVFNARTALNRLDRLRDEITFFFAQGRRPQPPPWTRPVQGFRANAPNSVPTSRPFRRAPTTSSNSTVNSFWRRSILYLGRVFKGSGRPRNDGGGSKGLR